MPVIYVIENMLTRHVYIGSTINYKSRLDQHRTYLKHNKHCNDHLQNSWNKYGGNNFSFYIIETTKDPYLLAERETYWIKYYTHLLGRRKIFNILLIAYSSRGFIQSEETRKKRIVTLKSKQVHPNSLVCLKKLHEFQKGKPMNEGCRAGHMAKLTGVSLSKEHCKKMSEAHLARMKKPETIEKYSKRAKFSKEDIIKIIEMRSIGMTFRQIAKLFNTSHPIITRIFKKKTLVYGVLSDPMPHEKRYLKRDRNPATTIFH